MEIKRLIKNKAQQYYQHYLDLHESEIVRNVVECEDFIPCKNEKPKSVNSIAIIYGKILQYSGGHTSILRLGTGLINAGICVTFVSFDNQSKAEMEKIAKSNYANVKGQFSSFCDAIGNKFDIIIATSWQSVYYARKFDSYLMYFVQDFEPYFFKLNERYLLAKKTYELGLHMVSLGTWNIEQIKKNCVLNDSTILNSIDFPYEPKEYTQEVRDYKQYANKKSFVIAVYSKEDGKRIPNLIQIIIKRAVKTLKKQDINLDVRFFGFNSRTSLIVGENMGKLSKTEMNNLYREADFGMVASMTNISLVPYEMLATGLPVIEFMDGSFPYFFGKETSILIDYNYKTLVSKILEYTSHPEYITKMMNNATKYMNSLTWENSCKQFVDIIAKIESK